MTASERIRTSIEALPGRNRTPWHVENAFDVSAEQVNAWIAEATNAPAATYIALMGPHVGEKVAALLAVLDRISLLIVVDKHDNEISLDLLDAFRALEAAIEGEQR